MTSKEIRASFLSFFKEKSHEIVASAPMVLKSDPSLLFTNAGMNQFKEYFLGNTVAQNKRIADTQKCLRVSGKHNDLEEVGMDTYHHTMFEMLGNWSFGDYFKKEAISWAWEFLTEVCGIEKDRLYVTVFEGDQKENLAFDQEAFDYWSGIVAKERILNGNKKDNFWEMGAQGPCGPCSEIHVDIRDKEEREKIPGASLVNKDHPQVVEIWNLVFMQFNRLANGSLETLPEQHVDTGMGFERLCMVLQGVQSNYDTDVFSPIIKEIEKITNVNYQPTSDPNSLEGKPSVAIRVISDHLRAVAFSIADGQLPSNTGAGYVIRRILRRAIRYGFTFLGQKQAFIYQLVDTLVQEMSGTFTELGKEQNLITNVIQKEEEAFLKTLEQGLSLLDQLLEKQTKEVALSGKKVFELYDTYGFPEDLTALILSEQGYHYNQEEFKKALQEQKDRSRAASQLDTGDWEHVNDNDDLEDFIGYDQLESKIYITKYRKTKHPKKGTQYQIVCNTTPFYPEGGGQVGDTGVFISEDNEKINIIDTKKEHSIIVHTTKELPKNIKTSLKAVVNKNKRKLTQANHTATHLLHQALYQVLGSHVAQKGSMVQDQYLRFDFSHFEKVSQQQLQEIEDFVNAKIQAQIPLQEERSIAFDTAIEKGATALFGEKYGDKVRMIQFGNSIELCGGTHADNTGELWGFKITSESAVASGIRRIEAITTEALKKHYLKTEQTLNDVLDNLKVRKNPVKAIENLHKENNKLKEELKALLTAKISNIREELQSELESLNTTNKQEVLFLAKELELDGQSIKDLCFELGQSFKNTCLVFGSKHNNKALLSCYLDKALVENKGLNASVMIKELGKHIGGNGGGQAFFATAGGKNTDGIGKALEKAKELVLS